MSRPSGSPPPSWYKYPPPQGSSVGPPIIPGKPVDDRPHRSPERDRRSPGYDREAEWRRFQEWEKRNKNSPPHSKSPPRMPLRPPSPRDNPPPQEWSRRSPPRSQRPPEWGRRSRSPPGWVRRSPPRYGPPRGRSPPPRGRSPPRWALPPPEWDRYRGYPTRRSPPRWGPHPPPWENRRERYPPPHAPHHTWVPQHPPDKPPSHHPNGSLPPVAGPVETVKNSTDAAIKSDDGSVEEEVFENYELPDYDAENPIGQKYVIAVSGFFCKICHKFYNSESSAKITHCKSKAHYEKFTKWVNDKKAESVAQKRVAPAQPSQPPAPVPPVSTSSEPEIPTEPPNKIAKIEKPEEVTPSTETKLPTESEEVETGLVIKEEIKEENDTEAENTKYDPSDPTAEDNEPTSDVNQEPVAPGSASEQSDAEKEPSQDLGSTNFVEATLYNFRKMRVQQLKQNLTKRNLPLHGLKPLLLKRLEKALLAEAKAASEKEEQENNDEDKEAEITKEPEQKMEAEQEKAGEGIESGDPVKEYELVMHESDIEATNKKSQWITERELERELLQLENVTNVISMEKSENKMGKKTVVEWTIKLNFNGDFPQDGLNFLMDSHQQLPYRVMISD